MRKNFCALSFVGLSLCFVQEGFAVLRSTNTTNTEFSGADQARNFTRHLRNSDKIDTKVDGQLPSIFIIGALKGGSLSLLDLISHHPLLCTGMQKEPNFFSNDDNYEEGPKVYKDMFRETKCSKNAKYSKYIDGTPMLHIPKVWSRIADTYNNDKDGKKMKDNLKFIVLLREPVSRDFVWYQHKLRNSLHKGLKFSDVKTIKEVTEESGFKDKDGLDTRHGRYIEQLQEFTKYFRRDQIMVLNSQVIFDDAASVIKNIYQFLNVPGQTVPNLVLPRPNHYLETSTAFETCTVHHIPEMDCSYRDPLGEYYQPYNLQLYYWLKATKGEANINEPPFLPTFSNYKDSPCVADARSDYNTFLDKEKETILLREEFQTKTNGFHMPYGQCRAPHEKVKEEE